jgi:PhnB protein
MRLTPYILFGGNAREAVEFYKNALDGEILYIGTYGDSPMPADEDYKDKVMHATVGFGGNTLMAADVFKGQQVTTGGNIHLSVEIEDAHDMEAAFKKMGEGGKVTMELQDTFWAARFGMLTDKFGMSWMFSCPLQTDSTKDKTLDITD